MKDKLDFSWQEKKKIARLVCNGRISYHKEKKFWFFFGECDYYQLFIASQKNDFKIQNLCLEISIMYFCEVYFVTPCGVLWKKNSMEKWTHYTN